MFLFRRTFAVSMAALLVIGSGTACLAAKKKAVVKVKSAIAVPGHIMAGSTLIKGRRFSKPGIPEDTLAGIRLGRPAKEILARWGNPSRITVASDTTEGADQGAPPLQSGPAYIPPGGGSPMGMNPYAGMATQVNRAANELGLLNPQMSPGPGGAGLPPLPGYAPPMPGGPSQQQQVGNSSSMLSVEEVTWTYDLTNGITLEFIITDGLITQITVGGVGPWGLSKTRTGLQLGDTYKLVLWVCGYPENQKYAGRFLRVSYVNKSRALYTFLNKKLVGVTIAMVPDELK